MSRWLVTTLPSGLLLVVLAVLVVGGALVVTRLIRRRVPALSADAHNDVVRFTYGFIGVVYAFLVGFAVSNLWGQINTADGNARAEGAAVVQLARDAVAFAPADRARIDTTLRAYADATIAEWDTADLVTSPRADGALADLAAAYRQVRPADDAQTAALTASRAQLATVAQARTVRLLTARDDTGPPWPLWTMLLVTSALVVGTVVVYGVERAAFHVPMVVVVGVIVAVNLSLVLQLSHPYLGAVATTADPMREVLRVLDGPR